MIFANRIIGTALLILLSIVGVGCFKIFAMRHRHEQHYRFYEALPMAKPWAEVETFAPEQATAETHLCKCRVLYFAGQSLMAQRVPKFPENFDDPHDLPWIYDAIQVVIDPKGIVAAIHWNGESLQVRTIDGNIKSKSGGVDGWPRLGEVCGCEKSSSH